MRYPLWFLVLLHSMLGCSGTSSPPEESASAASSAATGGELDACGLLTARDIEEVMGWTPGVPEGSTGTRMSKCHWTGEGSDPRFVDLLLSVAGTDSYGTLEARMKETGAEQFGNIERVDAGDFAGWAGTGRLGMLQMVKNGKLVNVQSMGAQTGSAKDVAAALARKAAPRVP